MNLEPFSEILLRSSGLQLDAVGRQGVRHAIEERCRRLGFSRPEEYLERLEHDSEERQRLVEVAVVPETWFWRDPKAFEALARMAIERIARNPAPVRVLSIPCSTGEEAYTIVAALTEAGLVPSQFVVDAVDISRVSLKSAQAALYRAYSFRNVPEEFRQKYFMAEGDSWRLTASWQKEVRFRQANLLTLENLMGVPPYDFIFCRNLLIYFSRSDQARALKHLSAMLQPGGILFAGPGEGGVLMTEGFRPLRLSHAFAFTRVPQEEIRPSFTSSEQPVKKRTVTAVKPSAQRPTPSLKPVTPVPVVIAAPVKVEVTLSPLDEVRKLADSGDATGAENRLRAILAGGSHDPEAFYLMGLLQDARGDESGAIASYRKVLYLSPEHHEAMTHLALILESRGDRAEAERLHGRAGRIQKKLSGRSPTKAEA